MPSTQLGVVRMSTQRWRHYIVYVVQWLLFPVFVTLENEQQPGLLLTTNYSPPPAVIASHYPDYTQHTQKAGPSLNSIHWKIFELKKNISSKLQPFLLCVVHSGGFVEISTSLIDVAGSKLAGWCNVCLSNTWLLPFATLPLHCSRCFCLFDLYCQAAAADSGDSVHIVSIVGTREPQVRDQGLVSGCFILWLKIQ